MSESLKRSFLQRILGIPATKVAARDSWTLDGGNVKVDLGKIPELGTPGSGIRIEGGELPDRFLLIHGNDGEFHVFSNRCRHMGRRLDPLGDGLQCCSVNKARYDISGSVLSGPAKSNLKKYSTKRLENYIIILI